MQKTLVHEFAIPKTSSNDFARVRVELVEQDRHPAVDVRIYIRARDTGIYHPTKSGFTVRRTNLPELIDALVLAEEQMGVA